jgi:ATP-binding cassette, subfamily B, bacterial
MTEPLGRWGAVETIGRGVRAAPALRRGLGLTIALAVVGAGGRIVVPILVQQSIDRGITPSGVDLDRVSRMALVGLVCVLVAAVAQRQAVLRLGMQSEEALFGLRSRLFEHTHRLSLEDHNDERRGALVARVTSDVETLAQFFSWGALAWLLDGTLMVVVAGVMLSYDWVLALTAFVVAAPLAWVLRSVQRRLVAAYEAARSRNAEAMTVASELVSGVETLALHDATRRYAVSARGAVRRRADAQIRAGTIGAFLFPSGEIFSVLTISAVIGVGVVRGPASGLTTGAVIGFVFLTYRFLEPIAEFTEILDQTQTAVAGLRRVLGVLEIPVGPPPPVDGRPLPDGPLDVSIENLTFSYRPRGDVLDRPDEPPALVDVTARITAGTHVALVGETGSGKTTLGRLIARFADPTIGLIRLGGVPLSLVDNDELRRHLVVVPQEPFLFDGSIADNLVFARPDLSVAAMNDAVEALGLSDWVATLAGGLDTRVGPRGSQLSAGERQLVALLRASLIDPAVLVLDEATSSVDALTEVRMSRALARLAAGRTTISIAHRLSTAARADRVLVLEHGRLVEDGTHGQLLDADGTYARMYASWVHATSS